MVVGDTKAAGFSGTDRFVVKCRLGEGGMGIVYEVDDVERDTRVALKTLRRLDAQGLYRFKREFRALQDLDHDNLVSLGELFEKGGDWFFTMELVDGDDFHTYVRTKPIAEPEDSRTTTAERPGKRPSIPDTVEVVQVSDLAADTSPGFDEKRLRNAIVGMSRGLAALHAASKVHRDVKPTNVIIEPSGRVVLLDFGLISEPGGAESMVSVENAVVGTPAYMSPEQGMGKKVTSASDCYSLGVILYEALTGRLPFHGSSIEILSAKQTESATAPASVTRGIPRDLNDLCLRMLATDPEERPTALEILELIAPRGVGQTEAARTEREKDLPFCGRAEEFKVLKNAYQKLTNGGVSTVIVRGVPGIGKSRLVSEFLQNLRLTTRRLVVLNGRCFEREDIAFKAIDSLVDQLSRYWGALPSDIAAALLPREAAYLPRIFPVLERVGVVADSPRASQEASAEEVRTRAFAAFREVLQRLGDRKRLVLVLDDMQWVDPDSVTLLSEVLRQPDAPTVLLLLVTRSTQGATAKDEDGGLTKLIGNLRAVGASVSTLDVGPLARSESKRLAEELLTKLDPNVIARLATESKGSPFFLVELARYMETELSAGVTSPLSLEEMVVQRFEAMSAHAQLVLGLIVLAGEPIRQQVVAAAAGLAPRELGDAIAQLRKAFFVRVAGGRATDHLEPYHDRVRVLVATAINERRAKKYHRNLAHALESFGGSPERLARHYLAAEDSDQASLYAVQAAKRSYAQFDFNRAARLYQLALSVGEFSEKESSILLARTGEALAAAGFCLDAAEVYGEAANKAEPNLRLECHRRRAEQLLIGGHHRLGQEAIADVLSQINLTLPRTNRRALIRLFRGAAQLKLRGLNWKPTPSSDIDAEDLTRVDTCWSATTGLILSSFMLGPVFSKTGLLLALKLGEPLRVARHAACEAVMVGLAGKRAHAEKLLALSNSAATEHGSDLAHFYCFFARGLLNYNAYFKLGQALDGIDEAERKWNALGRERGWEGNMIALFSCLVRMYRGDLPELELIANRHLRAAERTGNRLLEMSLRLGLTIRYLGRDELDDARKDLQEALDQWLPGAAEDFDQTQIFGWTNRLRCALYAGDTAIAPDFLDGWKTWKSSLWRHAPIPRNDGWYNRGSFAVLKAAQMWESEPSIARSELAVARNAIKVMRKDDWGLSTTTAALIEGGVALVEGNDEAAIAAYRIAADAGITTELMLHGHSAKRRLGQLLGGDEGDKLLKESDEAFSERGVVDAERLSRVYAPGRR